MPHPTLTNPEKIVAEASRLLEESKFNKNMEGLRNPFGDGKASQRILKASLGLLGI